MTEDEACDLAMEDRKYAHYYKDVSALKTIDVYRVLDLWNVTDPCLQHALKKILVAGSRGDKDISQDITEAIDALQRWQEMRTEERPIPTIVNFPYPMCDVSNDEDPRVRCRSHAGHSGLHWNPVINPPTWFSKCAYVSEDHMDSCDLEVGHHGDHTNKGQLIGAAEDVRCINEHMGVRCERRIGHPGVCTAKTEHGTSVTWGVRAAWSAPNHGLNQCADVSAEGKRCKLHWTHTEDHSY